MSASESLSRVRGFVPMFKFIMKMIINMIGGLFIFRNIPTTVTIYGSARTKEDHSDYQAAEKLGAMLNQNNISIITGAGPGIMEAASKGAYQAGFTDAGSYGCNIILPFEQKKNPYLTKSYQTEFFFVRKFLLRHSSSALIVFPGGFGTMDELFESLTLIRTKSIKPIPTILVGTEYWQDLYDFLSEKALQYGAISQTDLDQLYITDDLDEVIKLIKQSANE